MDGALPHRPPRETPAGRSLSWMLTCCALLTLLTGVLCTPAQLPAQAQAADLQAPVRGVTLESIEDLDASIRIIASHREELTVRLVMDPERPLKDYAKAVSALSPHARVMAQLLDSEEMAGMSAQQIKARAEQAISLFGKHVDLWEVGNELNGEWTGSSPGQINAKAEAASRAIRAGGGKTAITLNYWSGPDCYTHPWEATLDYARQMPQALRQATDGLFLSVYETACEPRQQPSAQQLAETLGELGKLFPTAKLGIGEIGAQGVEDGLPADPDLAEKERIARSYYGMHDELSRLLGSRYVGGYFWWYFKRDAVDPEVSGQGQSLWPALQELLAGL